MTQPIRNLRLRSFTASALASTTANNGDVYYDSTAKTLRIFDAATVGGTALARADLANVTNSTVSTKVAASGVLTWNNITGKPQFSTVATSGQYSDLSGKPTIPSLGSVTVTGTAIDSTDSSAISFTPAVVFNSDITVENDITVRGELRTQSGQRYATETLVNSLISQAPIDYNNLLNLPAAFLGLSALSLYLGVTVDEFSSDTGFLDNSNTALPTEAAVRTYIDRRLGFEADGSPVLGGEKIGPNYVITEGQQQVDLGNESYTSDADYSLDASTVMLGAWTANFTATRTLQVSNLTAGRRVEVYVKNTNASSRTIAVTASITDTGHTLVDLANGLGGLTTNALQLVSGGAAVFRVWNAGGVIVGEVL